MDMDNRKQNGAKLLSRALMYRMKLKIDMWPILNTFQVHYVWYVLKH